jgi:hypothetical protein
VERTGNEHESAEAGDAPVLAKPRGLRDKLRQALAAHKAQQNPADAPATGVEAAGLASPSLPTPPLEELLGGEWKETPHGPAFVKEGWFEPEYVHGRLSLGKMLGDGTCDVRPLLGQELDAPLYPGRLGYFDLETTGTSGGTGTYAFLAGLGSFVGARFRLRQYFLANLSEERAMLSLLLDDLKDVDGLVTYNGKSFDLPCTKTRATLSRLTFPAADKPHLDLLHLVRRLRGHRMESCRLADAEGDLLGFHRDDDVPGWMVPSIYFDYIRAQRVIPIRGVLRHNRDDILSLVGVLLTLHLFLSHTPINGEDSVALARWWERACDFERASGLYRQALSQLEGHAPWAGAAKRHSLLLKRQGSRGEAVELWKRLWSEGDRWAGVELAKHYEHRTRDLARAETTTQTLLRDATEEEREALEHRLERLRRKRARRTGEGRKESITSPQKNARRPAQG